MKPLVASAPGKLVLSGEYAVLDGAPAICMAVDRRARVTVEPRSGEYHTVTAPGFTDLCGSFRSDAGRLAWTENGRGFELLEHVWSSARPSPREPLALTLDTRPFRDPASGAKIGLGSSAALTVALATALAAMDGRSGSDIARRAHRRFQGGKGSGVDIACALSGGIVEFRIDDFASRAVTWPPDLHYTVYWSGVAADTRRKLERLERQPGSTVRSRLGGAAQRVAGAIGDGDAAAVIEQLRSYTEALREFDTVHDLGIFTAGHDELADGAASHGVVYKPCGAGGGDVGMALAVTKRSLASFAEFAAATGFTALNVSVDPRGAALDQGQWLTGP